MDMSLSLDIENMNVITYKYKSVVFDIITVRLVSS